jgi:hypothetical protein
MVLLLSYFRRPAPVPAAILKTALAALSLMSSPGQGELLQVGDFLFSL